MFGSKITSVIPITLFLFDQANVKFTFFPENTHFKPHPSRP